MPTDPHANPKAMLLNMRASAHRAYQRSVTPRDELQATVAYALVSIALTLRSMDEYPIQVEVSE